MRADPKDVGGAPARHNFGQKVAHVADTIGRVASVAQSIYTAGKVIAPYVRPALTALAAVV